MHIGRYHLHTLKCKIGNVILMKMMNLPQKSRAFFVISDPPKFCWTSNHLCESLFLIFSLPLYIKGAIMKLFVSWSSLVLSICFGNLLQKAIKVKIHLGVMHKHGTSTFNERQFFLTLPLG